MANVTDSDGFVNVTLPTNTDVALGGNETNFPGKFFRELASRDKWLRDELESRTGTDATAIASFERSRDLSQASIAQGRLTLATGDPTPSSDIAAATTLYYTPYNGDLVSLWNASETRWDVYQFTERSLSLSGLAADANYDIFLYDNGGTLTLQAVGWSNSGAGTSARASAISRRNGVWVKTSDDRRYLGTIRTTATTGQCEDSQQKRLVWNVQNRVARKMQFLIPTTVSYSYSLTTWRPVGNNPAYQLEVVAGLDSIFSATAILNGGGPTTNSEFRLAIQFNLQAVQPENNALTFDLEPGELNKGSISSRTEIAFGYSLLRMVEATSGFSTNFNPSQTGSFSSGMIGGFES